MGNFNTKFKERSPKETIDLINNFFINQGYTVSVTESLQSEAGTHSCGLSLYKNQQLIITSCGKGMSYDFSLASGYAELYERFCNKCNYLRHPFFMEDRCSMTHELHGYYLHPDEKELSYEKIMSHTMYNTFFSKILHSSQNIQAYLKLNSYKGLIIGEPFYDLTNNTIVYHNQSLANRVTCSIGMCAGNTIEEALNQGLSEICEHIVLDKFFTEIQPLYYSIDPASLNIELQQKITNIQNEGYKIYIFDLSYNFNMPVTMSLLIDPFTQTTVMNFGSFPIFEIAVERVITELYQGIRNFKYNNKVYVQRPYQAFGSKDLLNARKNTLADLCCFDESIILNKIKVIQDYNHTVFVDDQFKSNVELVQYFIDLYRKHNYSIHYIDNSLDTNIKALYIIIPEHDYTYYNIDFDRYTNYSEEIIYEHLINLMKTHKLMNIIRDNSASISDYLQRFLDIQQYQYLNSSYDGSLFGALLFADWLNPIPMQGTLTIDLLLYNLSANFMSNLSKSIFYTPIKTYATIQSYVQSQAYNESEIQNILNNLFNLELTKEDIYNCFNQEFLFKKIVIDTIQNYYKSNDYRDIILSTIKEV